MRRNDGTRRNRFNPGSDCTVPVGSDNPSRSGNSSLSVSAVFALCPFLGVGIPTGNSPNSRIPADNIPLKGRKEVRNRERED